MKTLIPKMPGDSAIRPTVIVWIVLHAFVWILTVTMATDKHIYDGDPNSLDETTGANTGHTVNVKHKTECDYHIGLVNVLNCSNIHPHNLSMLDHVNNNIDIIHVYDVTNASVTELMMLSDYTLFRHLKVLNASHNQIKHLQETTFNGLVNLEKINLSHNKLTMLPDNAFTDLIELKFLDISNNLLITLPTGVPMLEWFDVSSNHITTLPETFSSILYPQRVVLLGKNPFRCDCKITWLKEWFTTRMYLIKYVRHIDNETFIPTCFHPENLKQKGWDTLEDGDFKCPNDRNNKEASINVNTAEHNSEIEIQVWLEEVGIHTVMVKWTELTKHPTSSIEIRFHKFGKSKDVGKFVIPLTAGSFRLKHLTEDTPYIICFSILPETGINLDCEEIVTLKEPLLQKSSSSMFLVEKVFVFISENVLHIILLFIIVFVTLCALSHVLLENDENKVKNDS